MSRKFRRRILLICLPGKDRPMPELRKPPEFRREREDDEDDEDTGDEPDDPDPNDEEQ